MARRKVVHLVDLVANNIRLAEVHAWRKSARPKGGTIASLLPPPQRAERRTSKNGGVIWEIKSLSWGSRIPGSPMGVHISCYDGATGLRLYNNMYNHPEAYSRQFNEQQRFEAVLPTLDTLIELSIEQFPRLAGVFNA